MRKLYIKVINLLYTVVKRDDLGWTMKETSIFPRFLCSENVLEEGASLSLRFYFAKKIYNPG